MEHKIEKVVNQKFKPTRVDIVLKNQAELVEFCLRITIDHNALRGVFINRINQIARPSAKYIKDIEDIIEYLEESCRSLFYISFDNNTCMRYFDFLYFNNGAGIIDMMGGDSLLRNIRKRSSVTRVISEVKVSIFTRTLDDMLDLSMRLDLSANQLKQVHPSASEFFQIIDGGCSCLRGIFRLRRELYNVHGVALFNNTGY